MENGTGYLIPQRDDGFYNRQDAFESIRRLKMLAAVTKGTLIPSDDPALWETYKPAP